MTPTKSSRRSLAEQLSFVLAYRNRPEHAEPVQSNWSTVPANDNFDPEEVADYGFERNLLITPSVQEIMRHVKRGPVQRNHKGQITAIGRLTFSDGTQTEKAYRRNTAGRVEEYDRLMPAGAMLRTAERLQAQAGGAGYSEAQREASNAFFADALATEPARHIKGRRRRREPEDRDLTAAESRALIAEAVANTPIMPAIKHYPPGLPCGGVRVSESFIGMQKGRKGETGSVAWEDVAHRVENVRVWRRVRKALREKDRKALDAAMTARTLADIGEAVGQEREYARRKGGKRALMAANDNLAAAIKKFVA
ncbi:MAG TPA: hypothetical protein VNS12_13505 [Pelagibacterium sp.]|uniref:hypothetical protein n=1 Tax=Pelagibacterium sp. TaxID=1967288 RepID=UPI002B8C8DF2|nr:hypothetical protein [Pelagibacterium sp.]HWJ89079.1 hypothetical protein [Pelagibacterium sp.]